MTEIYLIRHSQAQGNRYRMIQGSWDGEITEMGKRQIGEMVVTPREIDQMVGELSQVLAMGLNLALQPRLSPEEIAGLMNETM